MKSLVLDREGQDSRKAATGPLCLCSASQLKTIYDYMSVRTKLKWLNLQSLDFVNVYIEIFDAAFSSSRTSLVLVDIKLDDMKLCLKIWTNPASLRLWSFLTLT